MKKHALSTKDNQSSTISKNTGLAVEKRLSIGTNLWNCPNAAVVTTLLSMFDFEVLLLIDVIHIPKLILSVSKITNLKKIQYLFLS